MSCLKCLSQQGQVFVTTRTSDLQIINHNLIYCILIVSVLLALINQTFRIRFFNYFRKMRPSSLSMYYDVKKDNFVTSWHSCALYTGKWISGFFYYNYACTLTSVTIRPNYKPFQGIEPEVLA